MAHFKMHVIVPILLLMLMSAAEAKTPPGIAKNPSNARCLIKKYKHCYNLVHVCPKFCPDKCTVECVSCKPICSGGSSPPPPVSPTPSPTPPTYYSPPPPQAKPTPPPSPPTPTPPTPSPTPPTTTPSPSPSPPPPASHYQSPPPTPSPPTPSPPTSHPPSTPTQSPPTSSSPPPTLSPSTKKAKCKNKYYPQCYNIEHVCPSSCPGGCEVDCVTCKPVCSKSPLTFIFMISHDHIL